MEHRNPPGLGTESFRRPGAQARNPGPPRPRPASLEAKASALRAARTRPRHGPRPPSAGGHSRVDSSSACGRTDGPRSSLDARPQEAPPARRGPPRRLRPPFGGFLSPRQGEGPRPPGSSAPAGHRPPPGPPRRCLESLADAQPEFPNVWVLRPLTLMSGPQSHLGTPGPHSKCYSVHLDPISNLCTLTSLKPESAPPRTY